MPKHSVIRSLDALARDHTEAAVDALVEVMTDPDSKNADRIKAAQELLDRGHGKPISATISIPATKALQARMAAMSDDELQAVLQSYDIPRLNQAPFDDEPDEPQDDGDEDFSNDPLLE